MRDQSYSAHTFKTDESNYIKVGLLHILLGPLKLVHELTSKFLFLGGRTVDKVFTFAIGINIIMVAYSLIIRSGRPFVPFSSAVLSLLILVSFKLVVDKQLNFSFEILRKEAVVPKEKAVEVKVEDKSFEIAEIDVSVKFEDALSLFIDDPEELIDHDIDPIQYHELEADRLVGEIEKMFKKEQFNNNLDKLKNLGADFELI